MTNGFDVAYYWEYFVAGMVISICARLAYKLFKTKNQRQVSGHSGISENNRNQLETENVIQTEPNKMIPLDFERLPLSETVVRSRQFYNLMNKRRTVRYFTAENVPIEVIHNIIKAAGTAPSGAHTEPWTFVVVRSLKMKQQIRQIVEEEEEINYKKRMGETWINDLKKLNTSWVKEYLTEAPYLILVFKQTYSLTEDAEKRHHYYYEYSVALAAGILLSAIHYAGLASLTSTPLNCGGALRTLLGRPFNEKLVLLLPVGYPVNDCLVPDLKRKSLDEILIEY